MGMSSQGQVAALSENAKATFAADQLDFGDGLQPYSLFVPGDFLNPNAPWAKISWNQGQTQTTNSTDFNDFGGQAAFSAGIWSVGVKGNYYVNKQHFDAQTSGLKVSYEYMLLGIVRPVPGRSLSASHSAGHR